jgi:peptidyl-tRNA hydrolase, PTH1 family
VWLVVGLGNPGSEYERTRHNIGFMVAEELARRWKAPGWREKFGGEIAQTQDIVVLRPQEYMNVSGQAVQRTQAFYKIGPESTIVVHDEIDLPFGKLRVKVGGGHGGHNGLRSIIQSAGDAFVRIRCGVGKPDGGKERVTGHVLGGFSKAEQNELPFLIGGAADAVQMVLDKGATAAMNKVNVGQ